MEDWDSMTLVQKGRRCLSCNKTVIDFSGMTDEEVQFFFLQNGHKQVCGRFKKVQIERIIVHIPANILIKKIPAWQKYLIVLLICFGSNLFSCDVILDNNSLHAQTVQITSKNDQKATKKSAKKKKRVYIKKDQWETIKFEKFILGFTQTIPIKQTLVSILNQGIGEKELLKEDSISVDKENKSPSKENPSKKNRKEAMEFILPQAVLMRRRKPT